MYLLLGMLQEYIGAPYGEIDVLDLDLAIIIGSVETFAAILGNLILGFTSTLKSTFTSGIKSNLTCGCLISFLTCYSDVNYFIYAYVVGSSSRF